MLNYRIHWLTDKGASKAKLDSTTGLNNVSHKILSGIYDGMGNLLTGHPYTKVHNGLESAITTITNEIAKKQAADIQFEFKHK